MKPPEETDIPPELRRRTRTREVFEKATADEVRAGWDYSTDPRPINDAWLQGEVTPQVTALYRLMQKLPTFDGTVWRGISTRLDATLVARYAPGQIIEADAFGVLAAIAFRRVALLAAWASSLRYMVGGARDLSMLSRVPKQREVLFMPGTRALG